MTSSDRAGPRPDEQLEKLAAGIVERIGFNPPDLKRKLQTPELQVLKGPPGINSYTVRKPNGTKAILLGADLYPFLFRYTQAAATYFLPNKPSGRRPSSFWHDACLAMATTLNWIASPSVSWCYPRFNVTARQAHVARAFADCAYRFSLCHEMAHVILGHVDDDSALEHRSIAGEDLDVLRLSQRMESDADRLGMEMHYRSLPESLRTVPGMVSAVYFCRATKLLDVRLMLMGNLVDESQWKIALSHPPALGRVAMLIDYAATFSDYHGEGLSQVNESLTGVDMRIWDAANKQKEAVVKRMRDLINSELGRCNRRLARQLKSETQDDELTSLGVPVSKLVKNLLVQFNRSPIGVLHALELPGPEDVPEGFSPELWRIGSAITEHLALSLPSEFRRFRHLTKAERAKESA